MLAETVKSCLALRRANGFGLKSQGCMLKSFAAFSDARGIDRVRSQTAIEWAGLAQSRFQRAVRLGEVIRFARHLHVEDSRHEIPPPVFGSQKHCRPTPYIFSAANIGRVLAVASQLGPSDSFRGLTYQTFFGLLVCTGLRVSEAIRLRLADISPDGLIIRSTKFKKSRLVPLHNTAQAVLDRYLKLRHPYAPHADHLFVSPKKKALLILDVEIAFRKAVRMAGIASSPGLPRPTLRALRHTFAVRALERCPDGRDRITKHMLGLSTYLGHSSVAFTYWYLEATPHLMKNVAQACERYVASGGQR